MFEIGREVKVSCKDDPILPRSEVAIGDVGVITERDGSTWGVRFPHLDYVVFFAPWELSSVPEFYSTIKAAKYIGISPSTIKYYIYTKEVLHPILVGKTLVFTKDQLDFFQANRRKPGRPKKRVAKGDCSEVPS